MAIAAIVILLFLGVLLILICTNIVIHDDMNQKKEMVRKGIPELAPFILSLSLPRDSIPSSDVLLTGLMIEPRDHVNLLPVIENVKQVLPGVTLYIFHGTQNQEKLKHRYENDPRIILYNMNVANLTIDQYNYIMTRPELWRALAGEHVLVFQTDSVLFSQSKVNIHDYLEYDYVGAPWTWTNITKYYVQNAVTFRRLQMHTSVGNGGLSLRRRTTMLDATSRYPYLSQPFAAEDVYFSFVLHDMGAKLPTPGVARQLFFEKIESDDLPLGAHKFLPKKNRMKMTAEERDIISNYSRKKPLGV